MARRLGGSSQLSLGVGLFSREGKKKKKKNCTIKNTVQLEPYLSHTLVPCKEPYPNARYRDLDSCTVYQGKQWGYATGNITGRAGDIRSLGVGRRRGAPWARNGGNGRRGGAVGARVAVSWGIHHGWARWAPTARIRGQNHIGLTAHHVPMKKGRSD